MRFKFAALFLIIMVVATGCVPKPDEIVTGYYRFVIAPEGSQKFDQAWQLIAPESREQIEFSEFKAYWTEVVSRQDKVMAMEVDETKIEGKQAEVKITVYTWDIATETETETPVVYQLTRARGGWRIILPEDFGTN